MRYEYKRAINVDNDQLTALGQQGWELTSFASVPRITAQAGDLYPPGSRLDHPEFEHALVYMFKRAVTQSL